MLTRINNTMRLKKFDILIDTCFYTAKANIIQTYQDRSPGLFHFTAPSHPSGDWTVTCCSKIIETYSCASAHDFPYFMRIT